MSKNNTKTFSLSIQEMSFLNTLCKNMGYLRENVVGIHPGTYSHIKIQSKTFKNDDIDIIRKKFQTKFDKRLIFSGGTSCMYSDMKVGYLTKIDK